MAASEMVGSTKVHALLKRWPGAFAIFQTYGLPCPGCAFISYCDLDYINAVFSLDPGGFMAAVLALIGEDVGG